MKAEKRPLEFKALELTITEGHKSPHTIYFKEHSVREQREKKPSGRTLFIVNIPPYVDEKGLTNAFSEAGEIVSVSFSLKPSVSDIKPSENCFKEIEKPAFRIAYIVFSKVSELDKALKLTSLCPMNSESHKIKCGLKKYVEEYNNSIYHPKALEKMVEEFMKEHDAEKQLADEKDRKTGEEDDEGWVTVTKKSKVQHFARSEKVENKIMAKEEKVKKHLELKNFYTFQIRESKMKHIVALRQKFEEDKKKIVQIKQSRRFKPF